MSSDPLIPPNQSVQSTDSVQLSAPKRRLGNAFKRLMSIHWWMASCYLILFVGGTFMAQLPRKAPFRSPLYDFHKSIGVLTMALLTWRILLLLQVWWRKYTKRSPKLSTAWLQTLALHSSLYLFMGTVPIAGLLLSNSFKENNVKWQCYGSNDAL
jgi:cytochrome b561